MTNKLFAFVKDDTFVEINGKRFTERAEIMAALKNILTLEPDITLVIAADSNEHFRAIGKVIYASQFAGFTKDNVIIQTPDEVIFGNTAI